MRPRLFIGSSSKASGYVEALATALQRSATCVAWHYGAFRLGESTLHGLLRHVQSSDFAAFFFAPDDVSARKGELLLSPRDNVVFEAGLFTSYLGPDRCFVAIPLNKKVKVPSDLSGITVGHYDEDLGSDEDGIAVSAFAAEIKTRLAQLGAFLGNKWDELRELAAKFEFGEQFDGKRANEKIIAIADRLSEHCERSQFPKHRLWSQHQPGFYVGLLSLIRANPEDRDWGLIAGIREDKFLPGYSYYRLMDAIEILQRTTQPSEEEFKAVKIFVRCLLKEELDEKIIARIEAFCRSKLPRKPNSPFGQQP